MNDPNLARQVTRWAKRHASQVEITKPGDTPTGMWQVSYATGGYAAYDDPDLMLKSLQDRYGR